MEKEIIKHENQQPAKQQTWQEVEFESLRLFDSTFHLLPRPCTLVSLMSPTMSFLM